MKNDKDINMEKMEVQKNTQMIKADIKYKYRKKIEEVKQFLTLLKAKLLNKGISPDDTRTIQAHNKNHYFISNAYLQNDVGYGLVTTIKEDYTNKRFIYKGVVLGADNAIGVIESNVPISEILASVDGNIKFQEMLSKSNAEAVRNEYYEKIGEEKVPREGHGTFFENEVFALGTIIKEGNGKYSFSSEIAADLEEKLRREREEIKRIESMRDKDAIIINKNSATVVSEQDCWLQRKWSAICRNK